MDPSDPVEQVRDFNRYYTRRLGILADRYLGQDRPLSEARLLYEIGDATTVRELRARLGLDSGHLSRLLRSLEEHGLVRTHPHPEDGRVRVAALTPAGVRERADLDARSRAGIGELLGPLTPEQRRRLVAAQAEVRTLLRLAAVTVDPVADDSAEARHCLAAYAAELSVRFPEGYQESALLRPGELTAGPGEFLVAREEDRPVGCGVWQRLGPGTAEIRHLWVDPGARGLGLGRRLLGRLEDGAAAHGFGTVRLGTHHVLTEAAALYLSSGYREIPRYDDGPYHQRAFEKTR
ncbi:bifunctional helix-turn-helix transcriptional regulator/GNAT family N-acetyltransferase [Jidongwangia harbinensis]|uniref:bifunctional helix-turn-helix transcriptional regulator/GNAT family N-acetyltransferase n=1 Tax=Jidongwangia harbinensis TaxID=2878561 RepID=UPI001CD9A72E|nr:MarR family winged helix-turn-helix transcriptional regulator [Jidongwangia harbinensis]MCA2218549.1 MarR family winged helix-turn-helix transcriptional regulator [Jidongwangia harbinensis]